MHSPTAMPTDDVVSTAASPNIEIRALAPGDDATAFRTLNEEWISRYFVLEPKDIETLSDPRHSCFEACHNRVDVTSAVRHGQTASRYPS